jgi:hypothetical protein
MGLKQVDKLYKKMISYDVSGKARINAAVRSRLFRLIMDDIERLQRKIIHLRPESVQYKSIDADIRHLLLKEIQIIIDDYVVARQNGTTEKWVHMYGDIRSYVQHFYLYRKGAMPESAEHVMNRYGFYVQRD